MPNICSWAFNDNVELESYNHVQTLPAWVNAEYAAVPVQTTTAFLQPAASQQMKNGKRKRFMGKKETW